ncbi:hypothetical protein Halsa_1081 [Halanaerobium hydrogeniformans]|uniref:Uncharacterized protein n=1 Tax=Halanaerobium hydrogeniformans TaxID=656519 RepID=E4RMI4_HALHG|nr:hypothetical protein Halsa_1081 [Halanaerobium hydrogeniformans]
MKFNEDVDILEMEEAELKFKAEIEEENYKTA